MAGRRDRALFTFLLGTGANILVGDRGFRGLVIRNETNGIEFLDGGRVRAGPIGAGEEPQLPVTSVVMPWLNALCASG